MFEEFIKTLELVPQKFRDFLSKKNIDKNIKDEVLREHLWEIDEIKEKFFKLKELIQEKEAYFDDERNVLRKLIGVDEDKLKAEAVVLSSEIVTLKRDLSRKDREIEKLKNELKELEGRNEVIAREREILIERIKELEKALAEKLSEDFSKLVEIRGTLKAEIKNIESKIFEIEEKIKKDVLEVERLKDEELKVQHMKHLKEIQDIVLSKAGFFSDTLQRIMLGYLRKIREVLASTSGSLKFWIEREFDRKTFKTFKQDAGELKSRIDVAYTTLNTFIDAIGIKEPEISPAVLRELVDEVWKTMSVKGYEFLNMVDGSIVVSTDEFLFKDALIEILKNSIEALQSGGRIIVNVYSKDERFVEFDVIDTGPGVPEVLKDRIFEPFFTLKKNHLGAGLTRARRIIERIGGEIHYVSKKERKERGAVFRIKIPLYIG